MIRICWICRRRKKKYMQNHHVMLRQEDIDLTVDLCRGCHRLVGILAKYTTILNDEHKLADLITLARYQASLPDTRTVVKYEPPVVK